MHREVLDRVVAWKIHPAIGFARVGNSPDAFFYGPESFATPPQDGPQTYHDAGDPAAPRLSAVKRQGALFRVYGYDAAGKCLGEVTARTGAVIEWNVCLANRKGSASKGGRGSVRNSNVPTQERWRLDITPGPRNLSGLSMRAVFDDGRFMGLPVCLGEIRTDAEGRLVVLGGAGDAGTCDASKRLTSTTDNDCWYDDVSDGPVTATIVLPGGRREAAAPAWMVVTPPDFAPGIQPVATVFDALVDHRRHGAPRSGIVRPSFCRDVRPILERIAALQWADRRAFLCFGQANDAIDLIAQLPLLANCGESSNRIRNQVFAVIAKQHAVHGAEQWLRMTPTQFDICRRWSAGLFDSDWLPDNAEQQNLAAVPDPAELDRAALEASPAGALFVDRSQIGDVFMSEEGWRIDHRKCPAGGLTQGMPVPWHAAVLDDAAEWPTVNRPCDVVTLSAAANMQQSDGSAAEIETGSDASGLHNRAGTHFPKHEAWARGLPKDFPACAERLVSEWSHLGFVQRAVTRSGTIAFVEQERSPYLGDLAEYFHRLVNFEDNIDFAPKALELACHFLGEAKFAANENYAPFHYSPKALDDRLTTIYDDRVREFMDRAVPWECGEITWSAVVDYTEADEAVWGHRIFDVGRFSDAALRERFRQFAPENLTDGAWLQNIVAAAPLGPVLSRLARIWLDEVGNGHMEESHANIYVALMRSLRLYMPPVTSSDFITQGFVESAFLSPVFQFAVGRFPKRFLPELLGMTLFMEWEATPISMMIADMMAQRGLDPKYYRMHAAIDNIEAGHGALAREAVKIYLDAKLHEGGDVLVQEHWQRIWRGYVAWATLGAGHDEVVERMMLIDKKQIQRGSSLLIPTDILPSFIASLSGAIDPVSRHLRSLLRPEGQTVLDGYRPLERLPAPHVELLCTELNCILREGLYEPACFAGVSLSSATRELLSRPLQGRVEVVDLGRSLLEDAYPHGIAPRQAFPDIKAYCANAMIDLVRRKSNVAHASHRRIRWLSDAFNHGPEAVMRALLERGLVDVDDPHESKLFEKTNFGEPMYKVFSEEDKATIISWLASRKLNASRAVRGRPVSAPAAPRGADSSAPSAQPSPTATNQEVAGKTNIHQLH